MNVLFSSARLKLTLWYVSIIVLITASISLLFYLRTSQVISAEYERINRRLEREWIGLLPPPGNPQGRRITIEDLAEAKAQIVLQLLGVNLFVIAFFSIVGYWLTGKTLKPIQTAHEAQRQFVGDAAHELRTPITALKTSLEVNLLDKKLSKETKTILKENLADVISLESLSQQLLNLARLDEQPLKLKKAQLYPIILQVVNQVKAIANKKHIAIQLIALDKRVAVLANSLLLQEAILVLLDNAIKYSPADSTISITIQQANSGIRVQVTDEGAGIAKNDLQHIFIRFYRADQSRNKQGTNGYGLGLSIAQSIITQHHGKITVNSTVGKGSTFTIQLPHI